MFVFFPETLLFSVLMPSYAQLAQVLMIKKCKTTKAAVNLGFSQSFKIMALNQPAHVYIM